MRGKHSGQAEETRRRQQTRTKGRRRRRRRRRRRIRESHSTFYTSGYCIRIYYNLRIPEENDPGVRGTGTGRRTGTVSREDGREIDERRDEEERPNERGRTDRSFPMRRENISSKQKQGERPRQGTTTVTLKRSRGDHRVHGEGRRDRDSDGHRRDGERGAVIESEEVREG